MIISNLPFLSTATGATIVLAVANNQSRRASFDQIKSYVLTGYSQNSLTNNGFTATLSTTATFTIPGNLILPETGDILRNGQSVLGISGVNISIDGGTASTVFDYTDITFDGGEA